MYCTHGYDYICLSMFGAWYITWFSCYVLKTFIFYKKTFYIPFFLISYVFKNFYLEIFIVWSLLFKTEFRPSNIKGIEIFL